jgi:hypothetical protein
MRANGLPLLGFILVLMAGTASCTPRSDAPSSHATSGPVAAWEGANADETLLYRQAVAQGLDKHPDIQRLMVDLLLQEEVYDRNEGAPLSEAALRALFEEQRESFSTPSRIQLRRIFLKARDGISAEDLETQARKIHQQSVANPDTFGELARTHSHGPYGRQGGEIGFVTREGVGGVDRAIIETAFSLTVGAPPSLSQSSDGWNILWVPASRKRIEPTFEEVRFTVLRRARSQDQGSRKNAYIESLKAKAKSQP